MVKGIKIEVVVNNVVDDAVNAIKHPVDRFELVSAIELGGCTPTIGVLREVKKRCPNTEIACMNRPRGGNFVYTDLEFESMIEDTKAMAEAGATGIVFGFLHEDDTLDVEKTKKMIDVCHQCHVEAIFHKASDVAKDFEKTFDQLVELGIDRIMTNGQAKDADMLDGCARMAKMAEKYNDKVEILFGGGIRSNNIHSCLTAANCHQVHMTSKKTSPKGYTCLDEEQLDEILGNI